MSDFTAAFSVTIPAGTTIASPVLVPCNIGIADVESILVVVPAGCAGNVGFQIWAGGTTSYPTSKTQWFIFDDYTFTQEVSNQINSGQWAINAYNVDTFQHVLQVYFKANHVTPSPVPASSPLVSL
jgi:hypothetical protein